MVIGGETTKVNGTLRTGGVARSGTGHVMTIGIAGVMREAAEISGAAAKVAIIETRAAGLVAQAAKTKAAATGPRDMVKHTAASAISAAPAVTTAVAQNGTLAEEARKASSAAMTTPAVTMAPIRAMAAVAMASGASAGVTSAASGIVRATRSRRGSATMMRLGGGNRTTGAVANIEDVGRRAIPARMSASVRT
jgi:hypothetical protein